MQHPNTVAVEWAKNLELLPAVCREFISNPGSEDHLLSALTESVLSVHRPNRAAASAADPLGGGHWEEVQEPEPEQDLLGAAPAHPLFERPGTELTGIAPAAKKQAGGLPAAATAVAMELFFCSRLQNNKFARFGSLAPPASVQHGDPRTSCCLSW